MRVKVKRVPLTTTIIISLWPEVTLLTSENARFCQPAISSLYNAAIPYHHDLLTDRKVFGKLALRFNELKYSSLPYFTFVSGNLRSATYSASTQAFFS